MWQRRVLVEERVQEREAGAADARVAVDERDLAEHRRRPRPGAAARGSARRPTLAFTSTARPPSKRSSRSRTTLPASASGFVERTTPSVRRRSGLVKTSSVGMFDHVAAAVDRLLERRAPGGAGDQADGEVGARAAEAEAVEARARSGASARSTELVDVRAPGLDRVGLVQPGRRRDRVPEPLDVGLAEDRSSPSPRSGRRRSTS